MESEWIKIPKKVVSKKSLEINVFKIFLFSFFIIHVYGCTFRAREYVNKVKVHMLKLRELRAKITWINKEQLNLGFNLSSFENVEEVENFVYPFFHLIKVCMNIQRHINVWFDGQFEFLNIGQTEEQVEEYIKELLKIQKTYRIKLR